MRDVALAWTGHIVMEGRKWFLKGPYGRLRKLFVTSSSFPSLPSSPVPEDPLTRRNLQKNTFSTTSVALVSITLIPRRSVIPETLRVRHTERHRQSKTPLLWVEPKVVQSLANVLSPLCRLTKASNLS